MRVLFQRHEGEFDILVDLEQSEIGLRVETHDPRRIALAVGSADGNLVGIGHDVIIGDDIALGRNEEAGAQRLARHDRLIRAAAELALEPFTELRRQAFHVRAKLGHVRGAACLNRDDSRADAFDQVGEGHRRAGRHGRSERRLLSLRGRVDMLDKTSPHHDGESEKRNTAETTHAIN